MSELNEEKRKCLEKLNEMERFLPFLDFMIDKIKKKSSEISLECQLSKFQNLRCMIVEKSGKHTWDAIVKVEEVIRKLIAKLDYKVEISKFTECLDSPRRQSPSDISSVNVQTSIATSVSLIPSSTTTTISVTNATSRSAVTTVDSKPKNSTMSTVDMLMKIRKSVEMKSKSGTETWCKRTDELQREEVAEAKTWTPANRPELPVRYLETDLNKDLDGFELTDSSKPSDKCTESKIPETKASSHPMDLLASSRERLMQSLMKKHADRKSDQSSLSAFGADSNDRTSRDDGSNKSDPVRSNSVAGGSNFSESDKSRSEGTPSPVSMPLLSPQPFYSDTSMREPSRNELETDCPVPKKTLKEKLFADVSELYRIPGRSPCTNALSRFSPFAKERRKSAPVLEPEVGKLFKPDKGTVRRSIDDETIADPKSGSKKHEEVRHHERNSRTNTGAEFHGRTYSRHKRHEEERNSSGKSERRMKPLELSKVNDSELLELVKENMHALPYLSQLKPSDIRKSHSALFKSSDAFEDEILEDLDVFVMKCDKELEKRDARESGGAKGEQKGSNRINKSISEYMNTIRADSSNVWTDDATDMDDTEYAQRLIDETTPRVVGKKKGLVELPMPKIDNYSEATYNNDNQPKTVPKQPSESRDPRKWKATQAVPSECNAKPPSDIVKPPLISHHNPDQVRKDQICQPHPLEPQPRIQAPPVDNVEMGARSGGSSFRQNSCEDLRYQRPRPYVSKPLYQSNTVARKFTKPNYQGFENTTRPGMHNYAKSYAEYKRLKQIQMESQATINPVPEMVNCAPPPPDIFTGADFTSDTFDTPIPIIQRPLSSFEPKARTKWKKKNWKPYMVPWNGKHKKKCRPGIPGNEQTTKMVSQGQKEGSEKKSSLVETEEVNSPLDKLYENSMMKTGRGYGLQNFKIPKKTYAVPVNKTDKTETQEKVVPSNPKTEAKKTVEEIIDPLIINKNNNTSVGEIKKEQTGKQNQGDKGKVEGQMKPKESEDNKKIVSKEASAEKQEDENKQTPYEDKTQSSSTTDERISLKESKEVGEAQSLNKTAEKEVSSERKVSVEEPKRVSTETSEDWGDKKTTGVDNGAPQPQVDKGDNAKTETKPGEKQDEEIKGPVVMSKEEITQEYVEALIRKSFQSGEGQLLLAQAKLFKEFALKLNSKKLKTIQKIINSETDRSSSSSSESSESGAAGKQKRRVKSKRKRKRFRKIRKLQSSSSSSSSPTPLSSDSEGSDANEDRSKSSEKQNKTKKEAKSSRNASAKKKKKTQGKQEQKKVPEEPQETSPTGDGNEVDQQKAKRKGKIKTELDRLHEDIRSMFISEGVVTATGQRMCRMLKESGGKVNNLDIMKESAKMVQEEKLKSGQKGRTERRPPRPKEKTGKKDTSAERGKDWNLKMQPQVVLHDLNLTKVWSKISQQYLGTKPRGRNVAIRGRRLASCRARVRAVIVTSPNTGRQFLPRNIRKVKKLRGVCAKTSEKRKALSDIVQNLPLKMAKMKHLELPESSIPGTAESESPVTEKADGKVESSLPPEKLLEYAFDRKKSFESFYECLLCSRPFKEITSHYKTSHPDSEVLVSRLNKLEAMIAMEDAKVNKYGGPGSEISLELIRRRVKVKLKVPLAYHCRMCNCPKMTDAETFLSHVCGHTGEYRYRCPVDGCRLALATIENMKFHILSKHSENRYDLYGKIVELFEAPVEWGHLYGYLCSKCHYVQILRDNVVKHVRANHPDEEESASIVKIDMSRMPARETGKKRVPGLKKATPEISKKMTVEESSGNEATKEKEVPEVSELREEKPDSPPPPQLSPVEIVENAAETVRQDDQEDSSDKSIEILDVEVKSDEKSVPELNQIVADPSGSPSENGASLPMKVKSVFRRISQSCDSKVVRKLKVGPLEARIFGNSDVQYECYVKGCIFSTQVFDLFDKHVKISHANDRWNGVCELCREKLECKVLLVSCKLIDALNHLRQHENGEQQLLLKETLFKDSVIEDIDSSSEEENSTLNGDLSTESSEVTKTRSSHSPKPLLRVRNLLGDRLSTPKDTVSDRSGSESTKRTNSVQTDTSVDSVPKSSIVVRSRPTPQIAIGPSFVGNHVVVQASRAPPPVVLTTISNVTPIHILPHPGTTSASTKITVQPTLVSIAPTYISGSANIPVPPVSVLIPAASVANNVAKPTAPFQKPGGQGTLAKNSVTEEFLGNLIRASLEGNNLRPPFEHVKSPKGGSESAPVSSPPVQAPPPIAKLTFSISPPAVRPSTIRSPPPTPPKSVICPATSTDMTQESEDGKLRIALPAVQKVSGGKSKKDTNVYKEMLTKAKLCHLFKCMAVECSFTCDSEKIFTEHIGLHDAQRRMKNQKLGSGFAARDSKLKKICNWHQCAYCCEVLGNTRSALGRHVTLEHGHCVYQCGFCFYRAISPSYVEIHQNAAHEDVIKSESQRIIYRCRAFASAPSASTVLEKQGKRQSVRPYHCDQCGRKYFITQDFLRHLTVDHAEVTAYTCHICKNLCFKPDRLINHYRLHSYCTYQCPYCLHGTETEKEMVFHLCNFHFSLPAYMYVRDLMDKSLASNQTPLGNQFESLKLILYESDTINPKCIVQVDADVSFSNVSNSEIQDVSAIAAELGINTGNGSNSEMIPIIKELVAFGSKTSSNISVKSLLPNAQFSMENEKASENCSVLISSASNGDQSEDRDMSIPLGQLNLEIVPVNNTQKVTTPPLSGAQVAAATSPSPPNPTASPNKNLKLSEIIVNLQQKDKGGTTLTSEDPAKTATQEPAIVTAFHKMPPVIASNRKSVLTSPKTYAVRKSVERDNSEETADRTSENGLTRVPGANESGSPAGREGKTGRKEPEYRGAEAETQKPDSVPSKIENTMSANNLPKISGVYTLLMDSPVKSDKSEKSCRTDKSSVEKDASGKSQLPSVPARGSTPEANDDGDGNADLNVSIDSPEIIILEEEKTEKVVTVTIDSDEEKDEVRESHSKRKTKPMPRLKPIKADTCIRKEIEDLRNQIVAETGCLLEDDDDDDREGEKIACKTTPPTAADSKALLSPIEEAICSLNKKLEEEETEKRKKEAAEKDKEKGTPSRKKVDDEDEEMRSLPRTRSSAKEKARRRLEELEKSDSEDGKGSAEGGKSDKKFREDLSGKELYICGNEKCNFAADDDSQLKDHLLVCDLSRESAVFTCPHCPRQMKQVNPYLEHLRHHGVKKYFCGLCCFTSATETSVTRHMKLKHKCGQLRSIAKDPPHEGHFVFYPKNHKLEKEYFEVSGYAPGDEDKLPLRSVYDVNVKCAKCPYYTKVRSNMVRHLKIHVKSAETEGVVVPSTAPTNPVPCLETKERMFDKMTNLAASSQLAQAKEKTVVEALTPEDEAKLPQFVAEQMRYKCCLTDCNYITVDEGMLKHHIKALHTEITCFSCPHCKDTVQEDVRNVTLDKIGYHLKHHDAKLYKCAHCAYFHYQKAVVEKHTLEKHPDRKYYVYTIREPKGDQVPAEEPAAEVTSKVWECGVCHEFRSHAKAAVSDHLSKVHNTKSKYKCQLCDMRSNHCLAFFNHYSSKHVGEKVSYTKTVVQVTSTSANGSPLSTSDSSSEHFDTTPLWQRGTPRVRHIRGILIEEEEVRTKRNRKTSEESETAAAAVGGEPGTAEATTPDNVFCCPLCSNKKTYYTRSADCFRSHLYQELNYQQFACILCGKMFVDRREYERHHAKVHPDKPQSLTQTKEDGEIMFWVDKVIAKQKEEMEKRKRRLSEDDSKDSQGSSKKKRKGEREVEKDGGAR